MGHLGWKHLIESNLFIQPWKCLTCEDKTKMKHQKKGFIREKKLLKMLSSGAEINMIKSSLRTGVKKVVEL